MSDTARVAARRVLVRHLSEQTALRAAFPERLFGILDDLAAAGALRDGPARPPAPLVVPRPRRPLIDTVTGARVRAARRNRGWTLDKLAERSGVGVNTICKIQRGDHVGAASLRAVLGVLDLTEEAQ